MRFIRMLSLSAFAAIAMLTLFGASSAVANTSTSLCKVSTNPCPAASLYPSGTVVEGLATKPVLLGTISGIAITIECEHSTISGKTNAALANPLVGTITSIAFTGTCQNSFGGSCTVATAKTGTLDLLRLGSNVGIATSLGNEVKVTCDKFPSIECTFGGEPVLTAAGSPAKTLTASGAAVVAVKGSFCPSNPQWDAKYTIIQPTGSVFINE